MSATRFQHTCECGKKFTAQTANSELKCFTCSGVDRFAQDPASIEGVGNWRKAIRRTEGFDTAKANYVDTIAARYRPDVVDEIFSLFTE